jgi:hypothetical protein
MKTQAKQNMEELVEGILVEATWDEQADVVRGALATDGGVELPLRSELLTTGLLGHVGDRLILRGQRAVDVQSRPVFAVRSFGIAPPPDVNEWDAPWCEAWGDMFVAGFGRVLTREELLQMVASSEQV